MDARAAVVTLELDRRAVDSVTGGCAILRMVVRHMTPAVRPDDVLAALRQVAGLAPPSPPLVTRLAQGPLGAAAGGLSEPGAADSAIVGCGTANSGAAPVVRRPRLDGPVTNDEAKRRRRRQSRWRRTGERRRFAPARRSGSRSGTACAREPDGRLPACSKPSLTTENMTRTSRPAQAARPRDQEPPAAPGARGAASRGAGGSATGPRRCVGGTGARGDLPATTGHLPASGGGACRSWRRRRGPRTRNRRGRRRARAAAAGAGAAAAAAAAGQRRGDGAAGGTDSHESHGAADSAADAGGRGSATGGAGQGGRDERAAATGSGAVRRGRRGGTGTGGPRRRDPPARGSGAVRARIARRPRLRMGPGKGAAGGEAPATAPAPRPQGPPRRGQGGTTRTRRSRAARAQDGQEPAAEPAAAQQDISGGEHEDGSEDDGATATAKAPPPAAGAAGGAAAARVTPSLRCPAPMIRRTPSCMYANRAPLPRPTGTRCSPSRARPGWKRRSSVAAKAGIPAVGVRLS